MEDSEEDDAEFSKVKEFELRLKRRRRTTSSDNAAVSFEDSAQIESSGSEEGLERTGKHSSEPGVCFSKELDPIDQSSLKRQRGGGAGEEALAEAGVGDAPAKISDTENSSIGTGHRPGSASSPVTQSCPICGNRFSTSLLGPHVNRCLDSTSVGKNYAIFRRKLRVALPLASNQAPRSSPSEREPEQDKPEDLTATAAVSLLEFLTSLNIAEEVTKLKSHGYADLDSLRLATNDDLIKAGIEGVGRRKRILVELGAMFSERRQLGVSDSTLIPAKTGNLKALKGTNDVTLFPIFNKEQRQETSSKPVQRQQREHPFYKKVGGTTFTVDSFRSKPGACRQFFLSHFHSDHYTGLSKSFKAGVIFCTEITAKLVQLRLGVPKDRIQILTLNEEMFVPDLGIGSPRGKDNGAFVTAVDANHCPGAAMFLFRVQSTGKTILHSGDCRYDKDLHTRDAALVRLAGGEGPRLDVMHLDTTYCDPKYSFPHQRIIIEAVLSLVKRESFNSRTLFLFGTYQLGKEKLYLNVAESLEMMVFVEPYRAAILKSLGLPEQVEKLITSDPSRARIHVGSMGIASFKGAKLRLREHRSRFSNVVAIRPTGWTWKAGGTGITRRQQGNCVVYDVSYSEHSSFSELKDFVKQFNPKRVIPTVGCRSRDDSKRMHELLAHKDEF